MSAFYEYLQSYFFHTNILFITFKRFKIILYMLQNSSKRELKKISIIVSMFNEEDVILLFWNTLNLVLEEIQYEREVIFVNDGSVDNSRIIINDICAKHTHVKNIHFSKNFGHEAAMLAGIDKSTGDVIICLDADLQHPPDKIFAMIKAYNDGYDIVNMVRKERHDGGLYKRLTSKVFYFMLNKISPIKFEQNASDFFMISKRVANILKSEYRERARFIRGFIQSVGFKKTTIEFTANARIGGKSKYSFFKLLILSTVAIVSFSKIPLYLGLLMGIICSVFSLIVGIYSIVMRIFGNVPPGYTTTVVLISVLFAVQFFLIGIIGVYIGYLFDENKKRPIYIIDEDDSNY